MAAKKDDSPFLTTGDRLRNFLGWAFVLSILMHVLLGPLIPFKATEAHDQETEKVSVTKKIKVKVPTPPPPTPTPKPTVQPKTTPPPKKQVTVPQPKLLVHPPKTTSVGGGSNQNKYVPPPKGSENGVPQGTTATGAPAAATPGPPASTPTPKPQCAVPTKDATMVNGVAPEYPEVAKEQNLGPVVVLVKITLSASASVQDASILQSSGNSAIDRAAIVAARQSSYSAAVENCQPVAGTYSFRASFDPSQ